jgi:hypothetical protein
LAHEQHFHRAQTILGDGEFGRERHDHRHRAVDRGIFEESLFGNAIGRHWLLRLYPSE